MDAATVETPALAQPLTPPATPAPAPAPITLERLLAPDTLMRAWERVQRNGGAAGCDHQTIAAFGRHLSAELERLRAEVLQCDYTPRPLHLVPIPKRHGGTRTLAIPAVRDRVLQTALAQLLSPRIDANFNDDSYAYRPGRSVAQAVARVQECRRAGLVHVVDADIHGFFDHIDHARILRLFNEQVGDPDVGHLVALWLSAVMQGQGQRHLQVEGIAQGSPLSPLLANLYLDDFDRTLQDAGLVSVRYADDFIVLCASAEQAAQALEQIQALLV
ncbi:MAG: reverse transcriptase domain-containing protein [Macromonas sp.]